MKKLLFPIIAISFVLFSGNILFAENKDISISKDTSKINVSADFVSRYIWRGLDYGKAPSIQPTFSLIKGGFEIGVWGAFNTVGSYHELDPYIKYTLKKFTLSFTDYFVHSEMNPNDTRYFDYRSKTTNHTFEGALQYKGPDKFPISVLVGTYFYGNDRKITPDLTDSTKTTIKQNYSSYIELGYTVKCRNKTFDLFIGLTPKAGAYGNTFGVVNAGITGYKTIEVSKTFSIPVKASVIANPQERNLFFILGITI